MTWLKNVFEALVSYSPTTLIIGIVIIVLSVVDAFFSKKNGRERALSVAVAILSVLLLIVQGKSSEVAAATAKTDLQLALQKQKEELTGTFNAGEIRGQHTHPQKLPQ